MIAFPEPEYRSRLRRVREQLACRGLDALYVTSPPNLYYLTGYESIWYDPASLTGLLVRTDSDDLRFFASSEQRSLARATIVPDDAVVHFAERHGIPSIVAALRTRRSRAVGLERWSWTPSPVVVARLAEELGELGTAVVDGSWIVDDVRLVKSPLEILCVRRAAAIVERSFESLHEVVRPGVSELEIAAEINLLMARQGGEEGALRVFVKSGSDVNLHGAAASRRVLEPGDLVLVDVCGVYNRYHVDVCRTFCLGVHHPARSALAKAAGSVRAVQRAVEVGTPLAEAQRAADEYIDRAGLRCCAWWVGGFSLGVSLPPDWVGHAWLSQGNVYGPATTSGETLGFQPGYVTTYENVFDDPAGGWAAACTDTLLMNQDGLELLSRIPRELIEV